MNKITLVVMVGIIMFTAGIIVASPTETLAANPVLTLILNEVIPGLDTIGDRLSNIENALGICTDGETQPCGTDVGACQEGTSTCAGGVFGSCIGEIGPTTEVCDALDNDCDGSVDEGIVIACGSNVGVCSEGTSTCADGMFGECIGGIGPSTEVCDGVLDENCNGVVDENCSCVSGETIACGFNDVGVCSFGTQTCDGIGEFGECIGVVNPSAEICDGADNDCDGQVDEGVTNACGLCGPVPPEFCDGVDNDCDGSIDNGGLCITDTVVINEIYYDQPGTDGTEIFVELYGPPGFHLFEYSLLGINGADGTIYANVPFGDVFIPDGFFVIAQGQAEGPTLAARDFISNVDWQNGPDVIVLLDPDGLIVDAIGYGDLPLMNVEGIPAPDAPSGSSLTRNVSHTDTDDNFSDFSIATPTPGS